MKRHLPLVCLVAAAAAAQCPIVEDFTAGRTAGARLQDPGEFTAWGWRVTSEQSQIRYDLGRHYRKGSVELEIRGPLNQPLKRTAFAAWNEEAGADGDRKTQGFFQLRFQQGAMMLRLTYRPGGRSFEGKTEPVEWRDKWYTIRGAWDTAGGESHLWLDGKLLKSGKFNSAFEGFRWVFIGKDNYQKQFSIPGVVYRSLKVCVEE
jgi:hypothetical protein